MARILTVSDNPSIRTGMGRVHKEIALGLHNRGHHVETLGWFSSLHLENKMPFRVHPTNNQYYGQDVFDDVVAAARPEIVITIGDPWMIAHISDSKRCYTRNRFQWLLYCPIDGATTEEKMPPTWNAILDDADRIIAYTEYGKRIMGNSIPHRLEDMRLIPHGVDTNVFYPISSEERTALRLGVKIDRVIDGKLKKRLVYLVVARNQFRKNIPEIAKAWAQFAPDHPDALFWPHMVFQDPMGWNLDEVFDIVGIRKSMGCFDAIAHSPSQLHLMPDHDLNKLYNVADIFLLMSGEGFGLPTIEAMACGKPVILLDHSANTELGRGRGELVKVGHYNTGKYCTERPFPDRDDLAKAMDIMYQSEERRQMCGAAAHEFITRGDPNLYGGNPLTWDAAVDEWDRLIYDVQHPLSKPIKMREVC
jgi:glycosyltransferase involved in cell wall biosynthesis